MCVGASDARLLLRGAMNAAARLAYRVNIQRHDLAARVEPAENCPGLLIRVPVAELQTAALVPLRERVDMGESFRRGCLKFHSLLVLIRRHG